MKTKTKIKRLQLENVNEDLRVGTKKDGKKYTVRNDRRRYFFPDEWTKFINLVKNKKHRFFFYTLIFTGARIMEALNIKYEDIDIERGTIILKVVKQRKAKKGFKSLGKTRGFFVSSNFIKEYKSFIRGESFNKKDFIFLDNKKLPENYDSLNNQEKQKYFFSKVVMYSNLIKKYIKETGIKDYYNFSPHNFRKTYGMWHRIFIQDSGELCYRMGHDMDTFINHYGSSLIFTEEERRKIIKIMGDVK